MTDKSQTVTPKETVLSIRDTVKEVTLISSGQRGPKGETGADSNVPGPKGDPGQDAVLIIPEVLHGGFF